MTEDLNPLESNRTWTIRELAAMTGEDLADFPDENEVHKLAVDVVGGFLGGVEQGGARAHFGDRVVTLERGPYHLHFQISPPPGVDSLDDQWAATSEEITLQMSWKTMDLEALGEPATEQERHEMRWAMQSLADGVVDLVREVLSTMVEEEGLTLTRVETSVELEWLEDGDESD